jgi:hypothetical protein
MPSPLPTRTWRVLAYIVGDQEGLPPDEAQQIDKVATEEAKKMVRAARGQDDMYLAVHVDLTLTPGGQLFVVPGPKEPLHIDEDRVGLKGIIEFVKQAKDLLPATHTMVILWGHGGGPLGLFADPHGGPEGGNRTGQLTLPQLRQLLNEASGICPKGKIDVLLVKSCYVATLEAAREIDKLTDYLICSQARVPLRTWSIWEEVFEQIDGEPKDVVNAVMRAIDVHYEDVAERNGRAEIPFSLIKPAGVKEFMDGPMAALCGYLSAHLDDPRIAAAIEQARPPAGGDKALLDVRALLANLINVGDPDLAAIAGALDRAIKPYVVVENTPAGSSFGGLGLFHFPRNPLLRVASFANDVTEEKYAELLFSQGTQWHKVAFPSAAGAAIAGTVDN